jgi:hypothetical protein
MATGIVEMNRHIVITLFIFAAFFGAMLTGCATHHGLKQQSMQQNQQSVQQQSIQQQSVPESSIQSSGINVNGYVDTGATKQLR